MDQVLNTFSINEVKSIQLSLNQTDYTRLNCNYNSLKQNLVFRMKKIIVITAHVIVATCKYCLRVKIDIIVHLINC